MAAGHFRHSGGSSFRSIQKGRAGVREAVPTCERPCRRAKVWYSVLFAFWAQRLPLLHAALLAHGSSPYVLRFFPVCYFLPDFFAPLCLVYMQIITMSVPKQLFGLEAGRQRPCSSEPLIEMSEWQKSCRTTSNSSVTASALLQVVELPRFYCRRRSDETVMCTIEEDSWRQSQGSGMQSSIRFKPVCGAGGKHPGTAGRSPN